MAVKKKKELEKMRITFPRVKENVPGNNAARHANIPG